jgi:5'-nucleotidase (lipoprotein e(P4) family)
MRRQGSFVLFLALTTLMAWVATPISDAQAASAGTAASKVAAADPVLGALSANVYVQTSAEYRACCYGVYAAARMRLEDLLEDAEPRPERPAVVMDLDETVLDNSTFQTFLYVNGLEYSDELWDAFERGGVEEVGLVPGAKEFIERAETLGVTVIYLSNRNARNLEWTARALEHVGLNTEAIAERLYLRPGGGSSNKAGRRDEVSARYNVLMYFGDNLRDFSEVFKPATVPGDADPEMYRDAIAERAGAADDAVCHWGVDWFVLPNPIYGEWEKLMSPDPADILRPSGMPGGE